LNKNKTICADIWPASHNMKSHFSNVIKATDYHKDSSISSELQLFTPTYQVCFALAKFILNVAHVS
jgi:hypothetical protein